MEFKHHRFSFFVSLMRLFSLVTISMSTSCFQEKIDAILELIDYNWIADHEQSSPSDYVTEVTQYLMNVRIANKKTLTNVVALTTYMEACKHIAERMKFELVTAHEISLIALKNFDRDLTCFENFTAQLDFAPADAETLRIIFADARQLINVILKNDFSALIFETDAS